MEEFYAWLCKILLGLLNIGVIELIDIVMHQINDFNTIRLYNVFNVITFI